MKQTLLLAVGIVWLFSACNSEKDVYDPNFNKELGVSIPEGFEWSTTQKLTVNVEVNDEYNGKYYYAVRVYDKKPGEGVLPVAASGEVTGDMPFSQEIVIPATVSKLYIAQVFKNSDASEVVSMKEMTINGNIINCIFDSKRSARGIVSRDDDGISIKGNIAFGKGNKGQKYKVESGDVLTVTSVSDDAKGIDIEIEGKLIFSSDVSLQNWEIDVEDGGILEARNLVLTSGSELENDGYVYVDNLEVTNGATLENDENDDGNYPGGCLIAKGGITLDTGEKVKLEERSYMSCSDMYLSQTTKFEVKTGAWLRVNNTLDLTQGGNFRFEFDKESKLIEGYLYGALIQAERITGVKQGLSVDKKILVECSNVENSSENIESLVEDATGKIKIVGSACSGNFGDDEVFNLGTYTYIMEDQYPNEGDYDMNDIVVEMTAIQTGANLTIEGKLIAVGAVNRIIPCVKIKELAEPLFSFNNGDPKEAYKVLTGNDTTPTPIGTLVGQTRYSETFNLDLELSDNTELSMNEIDFYILVNGKDIHWNTHGEKSTWGMCIPGGNFKYPLEGVRIADAYPRFTEWFADPKSDWYNHPDTDKVMP